MTTEVRQQIDAELKKAGITEVRSEMVVASSQQTEMRVSSVQKSETVTQGNFVLPGFPSYIVIRSFRYPVCLIIRFVL